MLKKLLRIVNWFNLVKRSFEYNLNDKSAKAKIIKGAKRPPFQIVSKDLSSNLEFSIGAWNQVVQPAVKYCNTIKGDKTCHAEPISVQVTSVSAGEDSSKNNIDTLVVFYANRVNPTFAGILIPTDGGGV